MDNLPAFPPFFNRILGSNYESEEDFCQNLPRIAPKLLLRFLEQINSTNWRAISPTLIDRVITHLNIRAMEGGLNLRIAQRVASACTYLQNLNKEQEQLSLAILHVHPKILSKIVPHPIKHLFNAHKNKVPEKAEEQAEEQDLITVPQLELRCQIDDPHAPPFFINKILLTSASPVVQMLCRNGGKENQENRINLPPGIKKDTRRHLKEFLETGIIDLSTNQLLSTELAELVDLAKQWQMTELLNYLSQFLAIDSDNFDYLFQCALEMKAIDLFRLCLKSKCENSGISIKVSDFDDIKMEIGDLSTKDEKTLDEVCQLLKDAQKVDLPSMKHFTVSPYKTFSGLKTQLSSYPQSLKELMTCFNTFHARDFSQKEMTEFLTNCKNLQKMILPIIDNVWQLKLLDQLVEQCMSSCPNFTSIALYFRHSISLDDIKVLGNYPNVTKWITFLSFEESKITDQELQFIAPLCSNLEKLDLTLCHEITAEGLKAVIKHCLNLQSLKLDWSQIAIEHLIPLLAKGCPKLNSLHLSHMGKKKISDEQLQQLVQGCSNLKTLYIDGNEITDQGIKAIAQYCPNLSVLILNEATNLTDEGIKALAQGCPHLTAFGLHHCRNLTREGLSELGKECSKLEWIDLSGCIEIAETDVALLVKRCPQLKQVVLRWWHEYSSRETKKKIETQHSRVKIHIE